MFQSGLPTSCHELLELLVVLAPDVRQAFSRLLRCLGLVRRLPFHYVSDPLFDQFHLLLRLREELFLNLFRLYFVHHLHV